MRIAVNTRLLIDSQMEGIGWFTYETLKRITRNHPEHTFIFLFDRPWDKKFVFEKNVKAVYSGPPTRHVFLYVCWFELIVPYLLKKHKADLFLSPDGHLSLLSNVPGIPVIHDLNFHHFPEQLPLLIRKYYNLFFPRFAKKALRIATVSEFSKNDISRQYGIPKEKIDVSGNGFNEVYKPLDENEKQKVRDDFTGGFPFFIFIGLIIPRKNLNRLMEAFDIFKKKTGSKSKLLVVGHKKWWSSDNQKTLDSLLFKDDIIFTGRLSPEDLSKVLASAIALTYTPIFEGFGIPILEAFASGTPVITSNVSSMPEVSQDAAILVNPLNINEIAEAMENLERNPELSNNLIIKGLKRKDAYSWDLSAEKLWASINKAISEIKKPAH